MPVVLVTGAAGFLGRHIVEHHVYAGDEVIAIDDMSAKHARTQGGATWLTTDIENGLRQVGTRHFDTAYHFASPVGGRIKIEHDPFFNMDAFRQDSVFFRWAASALPERLVYPSSSAVYPIHHQRKESPDTLHESMVNMGRAVNFTSGMPDSTYGFTKMAGEHMAHVYSAKFPTRSVLIVRPFSGYGPGQPDDYPMTAIIKRALAKEDPLFVWGDGKQIRDFVYVSDIIDVITNPTAGAGSGVPMVMNIGTGIGTSFIELARMIAKMVGYEPELATLIDKPVGVHYRVSSMTGAFSHPRVTLPQGVKRTIEYYDTGNAHGLHTVKS